MYNLQGEIPDCAIQNLIMWQGSRQMISKQLLTRAKIINRKMNRHLNNRILYPFIMHLLKVKHKDEQN